MSGRELREKKTLLAMIRIYCRKRHRSGKILCDKCENLWQYAQRRIEQCPLAPEKPVCARCPIHCYHPRMREQVRQVMRFSGPRMPLYHPWLTIWHYWDWLNAKKRRA